MALKKLIITLSDVYNVCGRDRTMNSLREITSPAFESVAHVDIECTSSFYEFIYDLYASNPTREGLDESIVSLTLNEDEDSVSDDNYNVPGLVFGNDDPDCNDAFIFLNVLRNTIMGDINRTNLTVGLFGLFLETYRMYGYSQPVSAVFEHRLGCGLCLEIIYHQREELLSL